MRNAGGSSEIDQVREATDLVRLIGEHIALKPKGHEHIGLCPFHDDSRPSLSVVTHKGNAFYKCHSCGAGGDAFDFIMQYHKIAFGEALRFLADRAGITLRPRSAQKESPDSVRRSDVRDANETALKFYEQMLRHDVSGKSTQEVIQARGISQDSVNRFQIGFAPDQWEALTSHIRDRGLSEKNFLAAGLLKARRDGVGVYDAFRNRLIFPICDELGRPIAFGARAIDSGDEPKYLNSADSPVYSKSKTLYGLHLAKRSIVDSKQAIVVEGYTDVIACHQAGFENVIATLGTALTRDHARILSRLCDTVVLVFDGDEAGQKAADRALEIFFTEKVDVKICVLPSSDDPDALLKKPDGKQRFEQAIERGVDALEFKVARFREQLGTATGLSGKQKLLEGFLANLAELGFASLAGVRKQLVFSRLAELVGVSVDTIVTAMPSTRSVGGVDLTSAQRQAAPAPNADHELFSSEQEVEVPPARRRAEHDVLAVLIYQPDMCSETIAWQDEVVAVPEVLKLLTFSDPASRAVADILFPSLLKGNEITVQKLVREITSQPARALATSLYFVGERLCEGQAAHETLCQAIHSLHHHMSLIEYSQTVESFYESENSPNNAVNAAAVIIEQRRKHGQIASAISRGVRN